MFLKKPIDLVFPQLSKSRSIFNIIDTILKLGAKKVILLW